MMFDMLAYYTMLKKNKINIIYSGPIWADGIEGIGETLRRRLALDDLPLSASQSVFSVFVEQMNNMLMHATEKQRIGTECQPSTDVSTGMFILGASEKKYFLQSGNMMQTENVDTMRELIDYLNTLDKIALRKLYKQQIKEENKNPDSKGAGLGMIEIARRANSPIQYKFTPVENGQTFFAMYVEIG